MLVALRGLVPLLLLGFWIWCVIDVIRTEEQGIEYLPKIVWLLLVLFFPLVGGIAWLVLARPAAAHIELRPRPRRPHPSLANEPPLPDPEAWRRAREETLERYYEEKRRRELEGGEDPRL